MPLNIHCSHCGLGAHAAVHTVYTQVACERAHLGTAIYSSSRSMLTIYGDHLARRGGRCQYREEWRRGGYIKGEVLLDLG